MIFSFIASAWCRCREQRRGASLKHRAEKWEPVFRQNDAATKNYCGSRDSDFARAAVGSRQLKGFGSELKVFKVVGPATEAGG
jgi:hypothetical protein